MTIRAEYDPRYFRRFLWIVLGCAAFAAWCFYDARVKYPAELERAEAYWTPEPGYPGKFVAMERDPWRSLVREKNWPDEPPHYPKELHDKINSQYFYALISALVGIPSLLKWFMAKGSWVEGDTSSLKTSWGPEFRFDQVRKIDKTKWPTKGITRVEYESEGRTRIFPLDDFKFQREPMGRLLRNLEATLSDDQIVGGSRESEPEAEEATAG